MSTDTTFLVLHGLAIKKAGTAADVAGLIGADLPVVEAVLEAAVSAGRAVAGRGRHMLTPAGREWLDERYPVVYASFRAGPGSAQTYDRFEIVNREVLSLMTRWQTVDLGGTSVPNDHSDADYDARIIDELGDLHERAMPILAGFSALEPRLAIYGELLEQAYDRVLDGQHDYISGARVPSYHTVWFEMHEDLLRLLGRRRES